MSFNPESINSIPESFQARVKELECKLYQMIRSTPIRFDASLRKSLPDKHGIYRIFNPSQPSETVRAGRTRTAAGGLRQRIYQNHFMGRQKGNLRAQLVTDNTCQTLEMTKQFIRENLVVQVLVIEDDLERSWMEYFMLAVLHPRYCD